MKKRFGMLVALIASLLIACTTALCGCFSISGNYTIYFKTSQIGLFVGDTKTLTTDDFDFEPSSYAGSNFSFSLSSDNEDVVSVSGRTLIAEGEGSTTVRMRSGAKNASCTVVVQKEFSDFKLGTRTQNVSVVADKDISVYAITDGDAMKAAGYELTWYENGVATEWDGTEYIVRARSSAEIVTVGAKLSLPDGESLSDEIKVSYYDESDAVHGTINVVSGNLSMSADEIEEVRFSVLLDGGSNPLVTWRVNGEESENYGTSFSFNPLDIGEYEVAAYAHGILLDTKTVTVRGAVVPGELDVDFDTFYPSVVISWEARSENEDFTVCVDYGTYYVENASSLTLTASQFNVFSSAHTVKVRSEGDGAALSQSAYTATVTTPKVDAEAKKYLEKTWFGGNYYMSDVDEFNEFFDYMMLYREQPASDNAETENEQIVYLGFVPSQSIKSMCDAAFEAVGYTGSYAIQRSLSGSECTISITFYSVSEPSLYTTKYTASNLNGAALHVGTGEGMADYTFASDNFASSVDVTTGDQLYRAVERGYKPTFAKAGTRAEKLYTNAKTVLSSILDADMSAYEKAHSIYDWIMWRVVYDTETANATMATTQYVKYSIFYLDSVLDFDLYSADSSSLAVCDGMSKAYTLLCNMAGVECVRVAGEAGSGAEKGGHAWNKVRVSDEELGINNEWFVVDTTWGDSKLTFSCKNAFGRDVSGSYETGSHAYFLLTDAQVASTHEENASANYPATTELPFNYYENSDSGASIYASDIDSVDAYCDAIADYLAKVISTSTKKISFSVGDYTSSSYFALAEIRLPVNERNAISEKLRASGGIKRYLSAKNLNSAVFYSGDMIYVVASLRYGFS